MRVNRLLADAAAMLAVATLFSIDAGGVARAQNAACARVRSACLAAGFRQGAARAGRGVEFDCIDPILQHRRAPANSVLPLPRVNPAVVLACVNPAAARRASAAQAAAAAHAAAPTTSATPKNATAAAAHALPTHAASPTHATAATNAASPTHATAATNAASPTNATAPTNAASLTNAAAATNATAPTNAAMLTNAAATSAAAPAPGWPLAMIAALVALVAAAGAAIFLVARRRRPAPRPFSAPAPGPTPTAASSSSPVSPPTPAPDAPTFVAAGPPPTAQPAATQAPVGAAAVAQAAAAGSPSRTHDVFISYSSEDKTVADAVCAILEQQRIRCWITPRDVLPGEEWAGAIIRAIAGTRVVVLIFSASSNASHQVLREIERAVHGGAMIIPFRIQDTPPSQSLEYFISTPHWLDALTPPLEQHVLRLAESIKSLLAQAPP